MAGRQPTGGKDANLHFGDLEGRLVADLDARRARARDGGHAPRRQDEGRTWSAMTYIGDGGTSAGAFHEGINFAAVLEVPFVLIAENNGWAYSTPRRGRCAITDIADRPSATASPARSWTATTCSPSTRPPARRRARPRRRRPDADRVQDLPHEGPRRARRRRLRPEGASRSGGEGPARPLRGPPARRRPRLAAEGSGEAIAARASTSGSTRRSDFARRLRLMPPPGRGVRGGLRHDGRWRSLTYLEAIRQALFEEMERDDARVRARPGRRRLRRRLQGRPGAPRRGSARAGPRHAARRGGDRRGARSAPRCWACGPVAEMQFIDFISLRLRPAHELRRARTATVRASACRSSCAGRPARASTAGRTTRQNPGDVLRARRRASRSWRPPRRRRHGRS